MDENSAQKSVEACYGYWFWIFLKSEPGRSLNFWNKDLDSSQVTVLEKQVFFTLQGQILTSFEVQKFPMESFSNKYWFIFSLSFRVNCNSPSLSCPCIMLYGCQFMLVPLIGRKAPKTLTLLVRVLNRFWRKYLFLRRRALND